MDINEETVRSVHTSYGEQLNELYHGLNGWWWESYGNGGGYWHNQPHPGKRKRGDECDCKNARLLPRLHTDANLAIAEAKRVFTYDFEIHFDVVKEMCLFTGQIKRNSPGVDRFNGDGDGEHDVCEAILEALIAARRRPSERRTKRNRRLS